MTLRLLRPGEPAPVLTEAEQLELANAVNEAVMRSADAWAERWRQREAEIFRRIEAGLPIWSDHQVTGEPK